MRLLASTSVALVLTTVAVLAADPEATLFGTSVYTRSSADCAALKRLAAGGARAAPTVPETLSAKGYQSFDGACRWTNIDERYVGRLWTVSMACTQEGKEPTLRTEVWRKQADGTLTVTSGKIAATWSACPIGKSAAQKK